MTRELHTDDYRVTFTSTHLNRKRSETIVARACQSEKHAHDVALFKFRLKRPNASRFYDRTVQVIPNTHVVRVFEDES